MRVERLLVEDFGPIQRADLALRPVTVVAGQNEAGKSFLLEALGAIRFGTIRGLKVRDTYALTHSGRKGWAAEALVRPSGAEQSIPLRRTRTTGPDEPTLLGAMGDPRVWHALLNVRHFLNMKPAERKQVVADLLATDTAELLDVLQEKEAREEIVQAVQEGNLRRAHRLAQEDRRAVARALQEAEAVAAHAIEDPDVVTKQGPRPVSTLPLEVIEQALAKARERHASALADHEAQASARKVLADAEHARGELASIGGGEPWEGSPGPSRLLEVDRLMGDNRGAAATAVAERDGALREADRLGTLLKEEGAECPTCGQALAGVVKRVREEVHALQQKAHEARARLDTLAEEHRALDTERKALQERKARWEQEKVYRARLEEKIRAAAGVQVGADVPLEPTAAEVKRVESLHNARLLYDAGVRALQKASAAVARLQEQHARLVEIETCCTPDRMDDEAAALDALNGYAKRYAEALFPGPWVEVAPDWEITYAGFRIELASDSAAIRAGLVLALALGAMSRVRCVFVDRLEALDGAARAKVLNLLGSLVDAGEVETALVAVVKDEPPKPSPLPWLGFVWIENGTAKAVE